MASNPTHPLTSLPTIISKRRGGGHMHHYLIGPMRATYEKAYIDLCGWTLTQLEHGGTVHPCAERLINNLLHHLNQNSGTDRGNGRDSTYGPHCSDPSDCPSATPLDHTLARILFQLDNIHYNVQQLREENRTMSTALDRLTQEVQESRTVAESTITFIRGLIEQLRENANNEAAILAMADDLDAQQTIIQEAMSGTPSVPVTDPALNSNPVNPIDPQPIDTGAIINDGPTPDPSDPLNPNFVAG